MRLFPSGLFVVAVFVIASSAVVFGSSNNTLGTMSATQSPVLRLLHTIPANSAYDVAVSADGSLVYVANEGFYSISVLNTKTMSMCTYCIRTLYNPMGIAISPKNSSIAYVVELGSSAVSKVNAASLQMVNTISVGSANRPIYLAMSPDGSKLYVTVSLNYDSSSISPTDSVFVINTTTENIVKNITTSKLPFAFDIGFAPNGRFAYVLERNQIGIINTTSDTITGSINVSAYSVAFSPDSRKAYVTTPQGWLDVINTNTRSVAGGVFLGVEDLPRVALSPDGSIAYVVSDQKATVSVVNTTTMNVIGVVSAGTSPMSVAVSPNGSRIYVVNYNDNNGYLMIFSPPTPPPSNTLTKKCAVSKIPQTCIIALNLNQNATIGNYTVKLTRVDTSNNAAYVAIFYKNAPLSGFSTAGVSTSGLTLVTTHSPFLSLMVTSVNKTAATLNLTEFLAPNTPVSCPLLYSVPCSAKVKVMQNVTIGNFTVLLLGAYRQPILTYVSVYYNKVPMQYFTDIGIIGGNSLTALAPGQILYLAPVSAQLASATLNLTLLRVSSNPVHCTVSKYPAHCYPTLNLTQNATIGNYTVKLTEGDDHGNYAGISVYYKGVKIPLLGNIAVNSNSPVLDTIHNPHLAIVATKIRPISATLNLTLFLESTRRIVCPVSKYPVVCHPTLNLTQNVTMGNFTVKLLGTTPPQNMAWLSVYYKKAILPTYSSIGLMRVPATITVNNQHLTISTAFARLSSAGLNLTLSIANLSVQAMVEPGAVNTTVEENVTQSQPSSWWDDIMSFFRSLFGGS